MLKYFVAGLLVKIIAGFDDTITHVPVLAGITKTRIGRFAFSVGAILASVLAIFAAVFFCRLSSKFCLFPDYCRCPFGDNCCNLFLK